jgi:hypothetical protein
MVPLRMVWYRAFARCSGLLLWLGLLNSLCALAQNPAGQNPAPEPAQPQLAAGASANHGGLPKTPPGAAKSNGRRMTKPAWSELTHSQQEALAPLSSKWDSISEPQKRKWLALSQNFAKMSGAEQAKLHSRMSEWAALSPQQRTQARLSFGQTQQLSPDDKKAKWEAYQALPPEEKRKLAARAAKPPETAAAVKPVPREQLAAVPKSKPKQINRTPRIAAAPSQLDHNTLQPDLKPTPVPGAVN